MANEMTIEQAIEFFEEMQCKLKSDHMLKSMDGEATREDIDNYINEFEWYKLAISALREQQERRWIPVTERLPESTVIGCDKWGNVQPALYIAPIKKWKIMPNACVTMDVTHWMPLPQPPKGEK